VLVPTGLGTWRTAKVLVVQEIAGPLKTIKLMVGVKKILVTTTNLYIYPAGEERPKKDQMMGLNGYPPSSGTSYYFPKPDGFLQPGKQFTVEVEVAIVEADDDPHAERFWFPSDKDRVIWKKTFRQTPKEMLRLPEKIRREMDGPPDHVILPPPQK
jgi:hypothetical protein